jgi:hypothetical protein
MLMWSEYEIQQIWNKGTIIPGWPSDFLRLDVDGRLIYRFHYGYYRLPTGWEVHHKWEKALGGPDDIWNLQPRQCKANRADKPGDWSGVQSRDDWGSADWSSATLSVAPPSSGFRLTLELEDLLKALLGQNQGKNPWSGVSSRYW